MRLNGLGRLGAALAVIGMALLLVLLYDAVAASTSMVLMDAEGIRDSWLSKLLLFMNGVVAAVVGITFWAAGRFKGTLR